MKGIPASTYYSGPERLEGFQPYLEESESEVQEQFEVLLERSRLFNQAHPIPTMHNRMESVGINEGKIREIIAHANGTHPLLHVKVDSFIQKYLEEKREFGNPKERDLYSTMDKIAFVDRLLKNRPLVFMSKLDHYLLREGIEGEGNFDLIGTVEEVPPLTLDRYISYEEMSISALIDLRVPTHFINNGWRNNRGERGAEGTFEESGILFGMVGARLEKAGAMEWKHLVISPEQNTKENGYGKEADLNDARTRSLRLWSEFYECGDGKPHFFPTYEEALLDKSGKYLPLEGGLLLNTGAYKKRMRMSVEPFLLDANASAKNSGKKAYVHAVGIGLGVWKLSEKQGPLMLEVYSDIIKERDLSEITDIDFSWFPAQCKDCGKVSDGKIYQTDKNQIKIHFSKRNPYSKLTGENEGKLLCASYAWDGNSYPGNEYWLGSEYLAASGDPAAACSSMIAELQNPEINMRVSGLTTFIYE